MSPQPSWRPNLPESQLFNEKTWLQGGTLSSVAYGVNLALFIQIISLLSMRLKVDIKNNGRASRQTICLLTYVTVMFILSTLSVASQAEMTQLAFIENRDFPGGPAAYELSMFSIPINNLGTFCSCMANWFSDSLLLWRCFVVYGSSAVSVRLIMVIPGLMLLVSLVTGSIVLEMISRPSSSPWAKTTFTPDLLYMIVTLSLNIVLTIMIVIRLYLHRRCFTKFLGRHHAAHYASIISMLIESAAVMVVISLWFLIPFAMDNQLANIPMLSISQVQAAASYMIIFRVAQGTAWTSQTASSELSFPDTLERIGSLPNISFQSSSLEHRADSPVPSRSQNQFALDGARDALDTESNSRGIIYKSSLRDPASISEEARPNTN